MSGIFKANIDMNVRIRFLRPYVWNIVPYERKLRTIKENEKRNIQAFEVQHCRKILKIKGFDKVINNEILNRIGTGTEI